MPARKDKTAMNNDEADKAFQALHDTQRAAQMLYMDLRDAGDSVGAADAKVRANRLQNEIDNLISRELANWRADAEQAIPLLSKAATVAKKAVDQVEQDVQNAQKVVNAMKALDDAIATAMKFLA